MILHTGLFQGWWIGLVANAVIAVAFLAVAVLLLINAVQTKQVRNNPLGVAVVILYITCGGGHVVHMLQLLEASLGVQTVVAQASRVEYADWHMWSIDVVTAGAGIAYWMTRRRFPALVTGAAVFEDLRTRQKQALEINDGIVQGLTRAKMALDLDLDDEGQDALVDTLGQARGIITQLLGEEEIKKGGLRRGKEHV